MKGENLLAFIGGAILGAVAAVLLAPDSGENTRKKIKEGFDKEFEKFKGKMKSEGAESEAKNVTSE